MPTQIFTVVYAPESKKLGAKELQNLLYQNRKDTEWSVFETDYNKAFAMIAREIGVSEEPISDHSAS